MTEALDAMVGMEFDAVPITVEAAAVRAYCDSIGDSNPAYPTSAGDGEGRIAPPSFAATYALAPPGRREGTGLAPQRMVHGEQEFEWFRPARIGERLVTTTRIAEVYRKRNLEFMVIEATATDDAGEKVCVSRATILVLPEGGRP